jgi:hypothetical protein
MSIVTEAVALPPAPSDTVYWKLPLVALLLLVKLIVPALAFRVRPVMPDAPLTPVSARA